MFVLRMGVVRVKLIVWCLDDASSGCMADWVGKWADFKALLGGSSELEDHWLLDREAVWKARRNPDSLVLSVPLDLFV